MLLLCLLSIETRLNSVQRSHCPLPMASWRSPVKPALHLYLVPASHGGSERGFLAPLLTAPGHGLQNYRETLSLCFPPGAEPSPGSYALTHNWGALFGMDILSSKENNLRAHHFQQHLGSFCHPDPSPPKKGSISFPHSSQLRILI